MIPHPNCQFCRDKEFVAIQRRVTLLSRSNGTVKAHLGPTLSACFSWESSSVLPGWILSPGALRYPPPSTRDSRAVVHACVVAQLDLSRIGYRSWRRRGASAHTYVQLVTVMLCRWNRTQANPIHGYIWVRHVYRVEITYLANRPFFF